MRHCSREVIGSPCNDRGVILSKLVAGRDFDLWLIDLAPPAAAEYWGYLSDSERAKAARFVFERDRRRYVAAHIGLRMLLSAKTSLPPGSIAFQDGPFGKPFLVSTGRASFNLSHSEDTALVLIASQGEWGVDVEHLRPMPEAMLLAERNFSAAECNALGLVAAEGRHLAFLTGWTRKEACLKAIGSGLSIAPDTFTAGLQHDRCTTTIATPEGLATVTVQSFCHEDRCVIAWAKVEPPSAD